ncbi:hypothetical protein [Steroidobacter sp.]|uniref:hypothetical protein n=1 Tax=Steroidobacter sp. TaxID=1978227 RepID=UPI001A57E580|nr:hypothetical protein [Steroidobacter sp.]MBL8268914.1 hypothetical protein [Steroidobacter sp.]
MTNNMHYFACYVARAVHRAHDWTAVLTRLHDRNEDRRARGLRTVIDVERIASSLREWADTIAQLPTIMTECEVDAALVAQRKPEIERLATSLSKLQGVR